MFVTAIRKRQRDIFGLWLLSVSILGCQAPLPTIPITNNSSNVTIHEEFDVSNCENRGRIIAEDGIVAAGSRSYQGTEERVMQLLRNEAVTFGADTIVIDQWLVSLASGPKTGGAIKAYAHGYRCR
jgi:Domain of unknown function (DUF4156)